MSITINGNGTITGYEPVANGSITAAKLASGAITAAAMPANTIIQTKHILKTDTFTTSSASWNDIPSLNTDITMTSSSNKILVLVNLCILNGVTTGSTSAVQRTTSGSSTLIGIAQSGYGNRQNGGSAELYEPRTDTTKSVSYTVEDTPGTGTHNYAVMVKPNSYSLYVNMSETDSNSGDYTRGTSSLIVMEVAA
tara:strand:+ start:171 stop:755 length:585 start_codon:yes stop_codon:yes gene_type:complete